VACIGAEAVVGKRAGGQGGLGCLHQWMVLIEEPCREKPLCRYTLAGITGKAAFSHRNRRSDIRMLVQDLLDRGEDGFFGLSHKQAPGREMRQCRSIPESPLRVLDDAAL